MFELTVTGGFDAAHFLTQGYGGKCAALHGHTWRVEVVWQGAELDSRGMLFDFDDAKPALEQILERLDHTNLNEVPPFDRISPTSEQIAKFIYEELSAHGLGEGRARLTLVRVHESAQASAAYWPGSERGQP